MHKVEYIRKEEKKYHDEFYKNHKLFEPGSWLHKPVQTVMDALDTFSDKPYLSVLDLASGVGRNSIPIAETLRHRSGRIVCVDILDSSIDQLLTYSKEYGVHQFIETHKVDIESYRIKPLEFDLIVSVSALEHVSSQSLLEAKLDEMVLGTQRHGVNCIIINTNVREVDVETQQELDPLFEVNLSTQEMMQLLEHKYSGWTIERQEFKELEFTIERHNRPAQLMTTCITFVARKI